MVSNLRVFHIIKTINQMERRNLVRWPVFDNINKYV